MKKIVVPLSLIAALAMAPAGAQEQESTDSAAPAIEATEPIAPIVEAVTADTEASPAAENQDSQANDSAPQQTVSESQE